MKAIQLVLAACAALILTSACGGGGGAGGGGGGGVDVQALLQGTWKGDCLVLGSASTRSSAVFTGLSLSTSLESWPGNTTCTGTPVSFGPYLATYALGAAVTAPLGVASVTAHQFDHLDTSGTFYDLVHVDQGSTPNRLYFGDSGGANDGSTPALRPTALDAINYLHR